MYFSYQDYAHLEDKNSTMTLYPSPNCVFIWHDYNRKHNVISGDFKKTFEKFRLDFLKKNSTIHFNSRLYTGPGWLFKKEDFSLVCEKLIEFNIPFEEYYFTKFMRNLIRKNRKIQRQQKLEFCLTHFDSSIFRPIILNSPEINWLLVSKAHSELYKSCHKRNHYCGFVPETLANLEPLIFDFCYGHYPCEYPTKVSNPEDVFPVSMVYLARTQEFIDKYHSYDYSEWAKLFFEISGLVILHNSKLVTGYDFEMKSFKLKSFAKAKESDGTFGLANIRDNDYILFREFVHFHSENEYTFFMEEEFNLSDDSGDSDEEIIDLACYKCSKICKTLTYYYDLCLECFEEKNKQIIAYQSQELFLHKIFERIHYEEISNLIDETLSISFIESQFVRLIHLQFLERDISYCWDLTKIML